MSGFPRSAPCPHRRQPRAHCPPGPVCRGGRRPWETEGSKNGDQAPTGVVPTAVQTCSKAASLSAWAARASMSRGVTIFDAAFIAGPSATVAPP